MTNKEFVEFVEKHCSDEEFTEAIKGFYIDSANDAVKQEALQKFSTMVRFDENGLPSRDEVELLDVYEGMM